ncbi:MAG: triose-phosphate isomerase [Patescibacteria group bacterium]|jgi:triosephosphate isomerase
MLSSSRKLIIGNWKMNLDYKASLSLAQKITKDLAKKKIKNNVLLLPDFLSLAEIVKNCKNKNVSYGAQDVAPFPVGSYTGEVSLESLKKIGCKYVLVGHSERRQHFFDDRLVAEKMENIIKHNSLIPILCVGESWGQRRAGKTTDVIAKQLETAFSRIESLKGKRIVLAYEPIWAIGTGKNILPAEAVVVHKKIREIMVSKFKNNFPKELEIVYGGSVNLKNYLDFKNIQDISGLLIGGTSLRADDFFKIAKNF